MANDLIILLALAVVVAFLLKQHLEEVGSFKHITWGQNTNITMVTN